GVHFNLHVMGLACQTGIGGRSGPSIDVATCSSTSNVEGNGTACSAEGIALGDGGGESCDGDVVYKEPRFIDRIEAACMKIFKWMVRAMSLDVFPIGVIQISIRIYAAYVNPRVVV